MQARASAKAVSYRMLQSYFSFFGDQQLKSHHLDFSRVHVSFVSYKVSDATEKQWRNSNFHFLLTTLLLILICTTHAVSPTRHVQ